MNKRQREADIKRLLDDARYYEEQAVFDRHTASILSPTSRRYYDEQAKRHERMSQKRRAEARRLAGGVILS